MSPKKHIIVATGHILLPSGLIKPFTVFSFLYSFLRKTGTYWLEVDRLIVLKLIRTLKYVTVEIPNEITFIFWPFIVNTKDLDLVNPYMTSQLAPRNRNKLHLEVGSEYLQH
jgi:hypothetical protein